MGAPVNPADNGAVHPGAMASGQPMTIVIPVTALAGFPGIEDMLIGPTTGPALADLKAKKAPPAKTSVRAPADITSNKRFIWSLPPTR
jgi:hypothetical protein